ncbi:hypothetical protein O6H91_18G057800 [Diphasiastrum complanatum]|nr:hypothetical protein O6H91_18G057800 [Diphasiastrum complanatum]
MKMDSLHSVMEGKSVLIWGLLLLLFTSENEMGLQSTLKSREQLYNRTLALSLVEYAAAAYIDNPATLLTWNCSRCNGLTKGFQVVELIVDKKAWLQAYVGVSQNLAAIVIAFRGTQVKSIVNWMEDFYFREINFNYPGVEGALVHDGFHSAYYDTILQLRVLEAVKSILEKHKDLHILVTGHSMGGALASFCALDLAMNLGVRNLQMITFGQPRIGNPAFAAFFNLLVPHTIRMTHEHDIVPHWPPYFTLLGPRTYHHFAREVWITSIALGILKFEFEKICDASGEDPFCSRSVVGDSISDHLNYLGVPLGAAV